MEIQKKENFFQVKTKAMDIKRDEAGNIKSIVLEGYASTKNKDRVNDIVLPSAFQKALDVYMKNPRVFLQHDSSKNVGKTIEATINSKGLYVKTEILLNISLDGTDEVRLFDAIEKDLYKTYSIGYRINEVEEKEVKQDGSVVGYEWIIKDLDLMEISLVSVPANHYAMIKSISECLPENTKMSDEEVNDQLKGMTGSVEKIDGKEIKEVEEKVEDEVEENVEEETIEEEKKAETIETKEEETNEPEIIKEDEEKPVIEDCDAKEINVEGKYIGNVHGIDIVVKEVLEENIEEAIENVEETENSVEITEEEGEKNLVVDETKNIEIETKEAEVETKSFVEVKAFESKVKELMDMQSKEVTELRDDIKEIGEGFLEVIEQFKALQEYTKGLEDTMSKVVIKSGYTYETLPKQKLSKFGQAIKMAKSI